jgi:hypothetical protein
VTVIAVVVIGGDPTAVVVAVPFVAVSDAPCS